MKKLTTTALLVLAAIASGQTFAAEPAPLTRAQVLAELEQARKDGTLIVDNEAGLTAREVRPDLYPAAPASSKTRAAVLAELKQSASTESLSNLGD